MHIRHSKSKTVGVQTVMLKHPIKHKKKNTHKPIYRINVHNNNPTTQTNDDRHTHSHTQRKWTVPVTYLQMNGSCFNLLICTGQNCKFDLQFLSQCGNTHKCVSRSIPEKMRYTLLVAEKLSNPEREQSHLTVSLYVCVWWLSVACLTAQQHASVPKGRICSIFTRCHIEIEVVYKLSVSPSHSILIPGQPVPALTILTRHLAG